MHGDECNFAERHQLIASNTTETVSADSMSRDELTDELARMTPKQRQAVDLLMHASCLLGTVIQASSEAISDARMADVMSEAVNLVLESPDADLLGLFYGATSRPN